MWAWELPQQAGWWLQGAQKAIMLISSPPIDWKTGNNLKVPSNAVPHPGLLKWQVSSAMTAAGGLEYSMIPASRHGDSIFNPPTFNSLWSLRCYSINFNIFYFLDAGKYSGCWAQIRLDVGRQEEKQELSLFSYLFIYLSIYQCVCIYIYNQYVSKKKNSPWRGFKKHLRSFIVELKGPTWKKRQTFHL